MRQPSPRALLLVFVALSVVSFAGIPAQLGRVGSFVAELLLVIAGLGLALAAARPWLRQSASVTAERVAIGLLALIAVGQVARTKQLFPFMSYTMYGRAAEGDVTFYEYQARRRSGARERFHPSTAIATLGRARIVKGLARELDAIAELEATGQGSAHERALVERTLIALVAASERERTPDPVTGVEIARVVLPPPYEPRTARRQIVMTVAVEAAP